MTDVSLPSLHSFVPRQRGDIDVAHARRLAQRCESSAAAAKSWALIVQGRLHGAKPMTTEAKSVAGRICMEMATAADELRQSADTLHRLLGGMARHLPSSTPQERPR
jgi:hypothetical protein